MGDAAVARANLAQALSIAEPDDDRASRFVVGMDTCCVANAYLSWVQCICGEIPAASESMRQAIVRAERIDHVPTTAIVRAYEAVLAAIRGDSDSAAAAAALGERLARTRGLALYLSRAEACLGWAKARRGERAEGAGQLRQAVSKMREDGQPFFVPCLLGLLAEIESEEPEVEQAMRRVDEALGLAVDTGERWSDAMLHCVRGEILRKRDPANSAPAEEALLTAIAVARRQSTRTFELRAALALAKLYQSTGRPADAHAVLAPALEGFSATPEMPEIAKAQALLGRLA